MATSTKTDLVIKVLRILLVTLIILFPFGQLTTIPLGILGIDSTIHVYLHDVVILGIDIVVLYYFLIHKVQISQLPLIKPIALFIGALALSLIINSARSPYYQLAISSLYLLRWVGYTGILFAVFLILKDDDTFREKMYKSLAVAGVCAAVFGLLQYFLYPDLRNLYYLGWDPHYLRVFGTFFDTGFLGLIFILTLNLFYLKLFKKGKVWTLAMSLVIYIALALTYSRSSYLVYAISIGYIALKNRNWRLPALLLCIGIATFVLLPRTNTSEGVNLGRVASTAARVGSWQQSIHLIAKAPFFGIGFNTLKFSNNPSPPEYFQNQPIISHAEAGIENSFLFVWVTAGIVGLLSYIYLLISIYQTGDTLTKVSLLAVAVHAIFNNSLFYPWVMIWLWIIIGLRRPRTS